MFNLFQKFQRFMQGRYFMDTLNKFLLVTVLVLSLSSVFIFYLPVKLIFIRKDMITQVSIPSRSRQNEGEQNIRKGVQPCQKLLCPEL